MDKKKLAIYGGIGIAVVSTIYFVVHRANSAVAAAQNSNAATPSTDDAALEYELASSPGSGTSTASADPTAGTTAPTLSPTSDLGSILSALVPIINGTTQTTNPTTTPTPTTTAPDNSAAAASATAAADATYQMDLGRAPDTTALNNWISAVTSGTSVTALASSVANSPEANIYSDYESILGRAPDPTALANAGVALSSGSLTNAQLQAQLTASPEYMALHPASATGGGSLPAGNPATT